MIEMTFEYWNKLANQYILISSLLAGFSIAIIANLIVSTTNNRLTNYILKTATIAAGCFLVSVFGMTKIVMITTEGYPFEIGENQIFLPRIISGIAFILGIFALSTLIALSGWTKSKGVGIFTTVVAVLTLIMVLLVN